MTSFLDSKSLIKVIIGPNGAGKSLFLKKMAFDYSQEFDHIIAIAPTVHDRFGGDRRRKFHLFAARRGKAGLTSILRDALKEISNDKLKLLKKISMALRYTGFDPVIGIKLKNFNHQAFFTQSQEIPDEIIEELEWLTRKWAFNYSDDEINWLGLDDFRFDEINKSTFARVAHLEKYIKSSGVASSVEYFLSKDKKPLLLHEASSGEITFIATIIHLATHMEGRCMVLIDEPETSLHPNWQKDYIKIILDIFYYENPYIVIATHSPLLISGGEVNSNEMSVYHLKKGMKDPEEFNHAKHGVEELLYLLFGIITPKNRYLSEITIDLLNNLAEKRLNYTSFKNSLIEIRESSFDEEQKDIISEISNIGENIARKLKDEQT